MPLSELRPGMRCTAYSVVRGTEITSFDVEVVDIVSGDASANDGPRILVRLSGPAIDETGVGPGFSGSPIYCRDGSGTARNAGAISESIGSFGGKTVLATPIEEILANGPEAPRPRPIGARASRIGTVRPLAEPLTVSGLSRGLARRLTEAGAKARRPILAAPALPLAPFPPQPPRPGSALSVGYSSGDLAVGAVGTVAYVDGNRVWGFGHAFENSGLRSLLLQDAYVYAVISNPNVGEDTGSTYKLAAAGHTLGTISNDAVAAVVGRAGRPPATIPVRVFSEDADTGARSTVASEVVDETDVGNPTGGSALSVRRPARGRPGRLGDPAQRARAAQRHGLRADRAARAQASAALLQPLHLRARPLGPGGGREHRRRRRRLGHADGADRPRRLQAAAPPRHRVRRAREAPPRAAPGVHPLRHAAAARAPRTPGPRAAEPAGRARPAHQPQLPAAHPDLAATGQPSPQPRRQGRRRPRVRSLRRARGDDHDRRRRGGGQRGRLGARTLDALARRIRNIARYDGVTLRAGGLRAHAYRDADLRISGRASATVRVRR